jgi:hypothetical protein
MRFTWFVALSLLSGPAMASGPFGVGMGDPITKYRGRPSVTQGAYKITVPKPNDEFESYTALATPKTGICKVWGIGRDHDNDRYGNGVRSAYDRLVKLLTEKYGSGNEISFLRSGALWKDTDEWVMSIKQKERTVAYFWSPTNGSNLPENLVGISLEVNATSSNSSYLDLTYEFANFKSCKAAFATSESDGL